MAPLALLSELEVQTSLRDTQSFPDLGNLVLGGECHRSWLSFKKKRICHRPLLSRFQQPAGTKTGEKLLLAFLLPSSLKMKTRLGMCFSYELLRFISSNSPLSSMNCAMDGIGGSLQALLSLTHKDLFEDRRMFRS